MICRPSSIRRGSFAGRDALLEEGIERTAEGDVDGAPGGLEAAGVHVGGHVAEAHGLHVAVLDARDRLQPPGGAVDDDARLRLRRVDDPLSIAHVTSAIVPCPHAVE